MNYSLSYFLSHPSHVYVNVFRTAFENEYFLFTPSPPLSFYPSCFYVLKGQGYFSLCFDFLAFVISGFAKKKKKNHAICLFYKDKLILFNFYKEICWLNAQQTGEGNGNQLQYSYLENSMDRGAW